jgi:predicted transcriptional regulator
VDNGSEVQGVLARYYRQQKTSRDIADELGITTGAVEQILVRAKAVGRKLFGDATPIPLPSTGQAQGDTQDAWDAT